MKTHDEVLITSGVQLLIDALTEWNAYQGGGTRVPVAAVTLNPFDWVRLTDEIERFVYQPQRDVPWDKRPPTTIKFCGVEVWCSHDALPIGDLVAKVAKELPAEARKKYGF